MRIHAGFDLRFRRLAMMLYMSVFKIAIERLEVQERWDVGVCGGAVVAFVEVVGEDFPVIMAYTNVSSLLIDMRR